MSSAAIYKSKGVYNEVSNYFSETEPGHTQWMVVNTSGSGHDGIDGPFYEDLLLPQTPCSIWNVLKYLHEQHY